MIIPTIFIWFADWVSKVFKDFIKETLSKLIQSSRSEAKTKNKMETLDTYRKFEKNIGWTRNGIFMRAHGVEVIDVRIENNESYIKDTNFVKELGMFRKFSKPEVRSNSPKAKFSNCLTLQKDSSREIMKDRVYLNKEIFISAYYDEINNYYKFYYNIMAELDESYLRNFRKVDRRSQIKKNMDILTSTLAKNQPSSIKNSIKNYFNLYPRIQTNKSNKQIINRRSHSVNSGMPATTLSIYEMDKKKKQNHQSNHQVTLIEQQSSQQKKCIHQKINRIQSEKKNQFELPQLNNCSKVKQNYKLMLINNKQTIFDNFVQNDFRAKASAQILKQFRKANNIFSFAFSKKKPIKINEENHNNNTDLAQKIKLTNQYENNMNSNGILGFVKVGK